MRHVSFMARGSSSPGHAGHDYANLSMQNQQRDVNRLCPHCCCILVSDSCDSLQAHFVGSMSLNHTSAQILVFNTRGPETDWAQDLQDGVSFSLHHLIAIRQQSICFTVNQRQISLAKAYIRFLTKTSIFSLIKTNALSIKN